IVLFPILVIILIAVAVGGGVRRMTRPMSNLIAAARRIESGDYSAQVPEWGSQDIRSVARAFNSMSARLKTIDEQRRNFMAEVTHELRTPLSVIRGQAEAIPRRRSAPGADPGCNTHPRPPGRRLEDAGRHRRRQPGPAPRADRPGSAGSRHG
ncbi:MAG: hypothetical protein DMF54_17360, partial [Acidobacteria bacterium]